MMDEGLSCICSYTTSFGIPGTELLFSPLHRASFQFFLNREKKEGGGAVFLEVFGTICLDGSLTLGIVCIWSSRLSPLYLGATLHPLGSYSALVH